MIWLLFIRESPASLTIWIWVSVDVGQSFGNAINSVESNLIISLGEIVKRYFQTYPSPLVPAAEGSVSVNVGSSSELPPLAESVPSAPEDPLSIHT